MEHEDTTLVAFESAMMHMQKVNRRLTIISIVSIVVAGLMFGVFMYFLTNFEVATEEVTVDSESGPANYIGNDGEINNGISESQKDNDKKEK